jgi:di/tricarboxylate transporter
VAGIAHAAGVSLETAPGEAIPVIGFGQLTLFFTAIGVLIARTLRGRARQPRSTFTRTTVGLTVLSLVPDMVISAGPSTRATLVLTHLVAAAIVIPALSSRLPR